MRSSIYIPINRGSDPTQHLFLNGKSTASLWAPAAIMAWTSGYTILNMIGTLSSTWLDVNGAEIAGVRCTISGS